jgi:DNA ligase-1
MRFRQLVEYFAQIEQTSSRNRMVELLAELFTAAEPDEIDKIIYLIQGRLGPAYEVLEFGVGTALTAAALAAATGKDPAEIRRMYGRLGDYGRVAYDLLPEEGQGLTVAEVYERLSAVAHAGGEGAVARKQGLLTDLLRAVSNLEAKYLVRIPLGQLRLGVGDPTIMEALSWAKTGSKAERKVIERAYNICSDLGFVARLYWEGGPEKLAALKVTPGKPVRPALAERLPSAQAIIAKLGRVAVEPKLDGFRLQVHKIDGNVLLFSRNLENLTGMFPEVVRGTLEQVQAESAIFEGEAIGYDPATGEFLPFQITTTRRRKYDIEAAAEKTPLRLICFDLLAVDGEDYTPRPYLERRERLCQLIRPDDAIDVAECRLVDNPADLEAFFNEMISRGLEGIVAKRPDAPYQAGARNFNWIKLKRSYQGELTDTVDCVIVGYWYGRGQRARFGIGAVLTAVYDKDRDVFVTVTKLGTGFSEEEWVKLREKLDAIATPVRPARVESILEPDVWCEPVYVVEVQADEITRSPSHTCGRTAEDPLGYALRFPRAVDFLREDRSPEDATTVAEIIEMYAQQRRKPVEPEPAEV